MTHGSETVLRNSPYPCYMWLEHINAKIFHPGLLFHHRRHKPIKNCMQPWTERFMLMMTCLPNELTLQLHYKIQVCPEHLNHHLAMYDPSVKPMEHALIGQELKVNENGSVVNSEDNNMAVDDSPPDSNTAIRTPNARRGISDELKVKIKLIKLLRNHSIPIVAEKELPEWAIKSECLNLFSWTKGNLIQMRSRVMKDIYATVPEIEGNGFEPHLIDWCYEKLICADIAGHQQIYIRSFQKALHSLLTNITLVKEENLSFPHAENPTLPVRYPELQGNIDIDELHHREWWINTWEKRCKRDLDEIFVPIILYMDGIAINNNDQTTLTPLNITLGIFNTLTWNSRPDAWETIIYFHPTGTCDKGDKSIDNVNNLHSGLPSALSSLKDACNLTDGTKWSNFLWNKKKWSVQMKFSVAYFIGDTHQHNQLCGHYQMANTMMICRHCNCTRALEYQSVCLWKMSDFIAPMVEEGVNVEQYFKNISHYRVHDGKVFYDLDFGENTHNIHLASPGKRLHMHQLGCAKHAAETFHEDCLGNNMWLLGDMDRIASHYVAAAHRQLDHDVH
eukprot:jgi/Psemu1/29749/gm1.29749_g